MCQAPVACLGQAPANFWAALCAGVREEHRAACSHANPYLDTLCAMVFSLYVLCMGTDNTALACELSASHEF